MNHQKKEMRWGGISKDHLPPADNRAICWGGNKYKEEYEDQLSAYKSRLEERWGGEKEQPFIRHHRNNHQFTTSRSKHYQDLQDFSNELHWGRAVIQHLDEMSINEEKRQEDRGGHSKDNFLPEEYYRTRDSNVKIHCEQDSNKTNCLD